MKNELLKICIDAVKSNGGTITIDKGNNLVIIEVQEPLINQEVKHDLANFAELLKDNEN